MYKLNLGGFDLTGYNSLLNGKEISFKTSTFPGGEAFFRITSPIAQLQYDRVTIFARLNTSHDIMQLLMAVDALRRCDLDYISLVVPYIPYGRQDRVCNAGEALSLKVFANLLNSCNFKGVTTWDAHSSVSEALIDNLHDRTNRDFILKVLPYFGNQRLNIICPDFGATKKIGHTFDGVCNINLVVCSKERDLSNTTITRTVVPQISNAHPCLIVDDLCDGGATFLAIVDEMKKNRDYNAVYLVVTHGIFSKGLDVLRPYFNGIFTTNSRKEAEDVEDKFLTVIPLF